jgi:hypothetical protein
MNTLKFRICKFIPNLFTPWQTQPFALIVGSEHHFALVGIDLATCEFHDDHPVGGEFVERTFEVLWHRIISLLQSGTIGTGVDAVSRLGNVAATNLQFSDVEETEETSDDFTAAALRLYEQFVAPDTARCNCTVADDDSSRPRWRASPQVKIQEAGIGSLVES